MTTIDARYYGQDGYKTVIVASVLILMQFILVSARVCSRRLQKVSIAIDDYILFVATLLTLALCAIGVAFPKIAWVVTSSRPAPEGYATGSKTLQAISVAWMALYGASVALSKCAILLLYVRVFTTASRAFTVSTSVIGFFVIAIGITTIVGSVVQCTPVAYNWNPATKGHCINKLEFARYTAIPNVVTGLAMIVLPLPMVWRLKIGIAQKVALTATFLHGIM
ncbi:MAG: hypothetical protein Q9222_006501 [Ikaeria aurantiellina]